MNEFPIYQVPYIGNGMTIAFNAITHVVISHGVAIGAFAMLAFSEYYGYKHRSSHWENFARDYIRPLIIIITGVGAVTGVGIWFTISALAPRGTGSMLRVFFWPWFIEWAAFTAEVILILIYYFVWEKWNKEKKKAHLGLAFAYTLVAMFSGFLITGILGFMLTPDGWVWDRNFYSAFFNPSFFPQLFIRFGIAFFLGSVFTTAYLLFTRRNKEFQKQALPKFGRVSLISFLVVFASIFWYFSRIPITFKIHSIFSVLTSHLSQFGLWFWLVNGFGALLLILFSIAASRGKLRVAKLMVIPAAIIAVLFVAEFERVREFIRGPYLMPGYMYANQTLLKEEPLLNSNGSIRYSALYRSTEKEKNVYREGLYLFGKNCSVCHTIDGLNDIKDRLKGRSRDGIFVMTKNLETMAPFMNPFSGTDRERRIVAEFLYRLTNDEIISRPPTRFINQTMETARGGQGIETSKGRQGKQIAQGENS